MADRSTLNRRDFLHLTAVAAGGSMLAACGGGGGGRSGTNTGRGTAAADPTAPAPSTGGESTVTAPDASGEPTAQSEAARATPIKATGNYKQAPSLDNVAGLPPVAERLPKNPYVVPHQWLTTGKYGGHLLMSSQDPGWGYAHYVQESMYGNSFLRYLKDGMQIGPGLVESWDSNPEATQWTLHFREGLKWSDGKPWTTADVMYWWEDMVLNDQHPAGPPDDVRSGKGTVATLKAVDDVTLTMTFDAPAPITPDRLAAWVNRGIGPDWHQPKHYLQQFHPKYNKKINPKSDWMGKHDEAKDFAINPECPTMTGWKLKSLKEGVNTVWERNPYYWCVDKEGNQLPYIDGLTMGAVQDAEVFKLQLFQGKADYVHGGHTPLTIADYSRFIKAQANNKMKVTFWDSGSGTASIFFFNHNFPEPKMRKLIREPKFRQALSHAYNRSQVQKILYFNTGELTTGTLSPKGVNFNINNEGKQLYQQWRDSYLKYDPDLAKKMLDDLKVVDTNGDGLREMPDGSKLSITLDYPADAGPEHVRKNELLARDWNAIGVQTRLNPVPPDSWLDLWSRGRLMSTTAWEVGDNSPLIYPGWVVPVESGHWAPLEGQMFSLRGTPQEKQELNKDPYKRTPPRIAPEKGSPTARLWKLYDEARVEVDPMKRIGKEWEIMKIHVNEGPFFLGVVANWPRIVLTKEGLKNVPTRENLKKYALGGWVNPWILPSPAVYDPETYYWENPEQHTA